MFRGFVPPPDPYEHLYKIGRDKETFKQLKEGQSLHAKLSLRLSRRTTCSFGRNAYPDGEDDCRCTRTDTDIYIYI